MGGGPLTLDGEIVCLTNGKFIAYGPMGGGVERNYGPSMVFRVGGIDIVVITNNGQATDLGQFTSLGIDPTRYRPSRSNRCSISVPPSSRSPAKSCWSTPARLCSEIYTPELFTKVRRPVWPLDPIADPRTP